MARDSLVLAVLSAALSPVLKAESRDFSSARTSTVIHGFWLEHVVIVLESVTSSMHLLMQLVTDAVYSSKLMELLVVAASLNMRQ